MGIKINRCLNEIRIEVEKLPRGWSGVQQVELGRNRVDVCLGQGNTLSELDKKVCIVELVRCGGISVVGGDEFYAEIQPLVKKKNVAAIERAALRRVGAFFARNPTAFVRMLKAVQADAQKTGRSALQGELCELILGDDGG